MFTCLCRYCGNVSDKRTLKNSSKWMKKKENAFMRTVYVNKKKYSVASPRVELIFKFKSV